MFTIYRKRPRAKRWVPLLIISQIGKIADLMVEEALDRPAAKHDILAALATVRIEVMAIIMDFAAEVRQSERKSK